MRGISQSGGALPGSGGPGGKSGGTPGSGTPEGGAARSVARAPASLGLQVRPRDPVLQSERTQGFTAGPVYGRAKCLPVLGSLIT